MQTVHATWTHITWSESKGILHEDPVVSRVVFNVEEAHLHVDRWPMHVYG